MAAPKKVLVILSSVRDGRHGAKVAQAVMNHLEPHANCITPEILDPLTVDAPLLKQALQFMPPEQQSEAPSWMTETLAKIRESAGFVIVAAEYNCTIPPALTNLLDHFPLDAYRHKPASIITYSMSIWWSKGQGGFVTLDGRIGHGRFAINCVYSIYPKQWYY